MTEPEPEPEQDLTFTIRSPLNEPTQWFEYYIGVKTMDQTLALELKLRDLDLFCVVL